MTAPSASDPRLPAEPSDDLLDRWYAETRTYDSTRDQMREYYRALRAELVKPPKPKTRGGKVWRVEYAFCSVPDAWEPSCATFTEEEAAKAFASDGVNTGRFACVQITGAHFQVVPA